MILGISGLVEAQDHYGFTTEKKTYRYCGEVIKASASLLPTFCGSSRAPRFSP
jgi:hypothetical protein